MGILKNDSDPGESVTRAFVARAEGHATSLGAGGVVGHSGHDFAVTPTGPAAMVTALGSLRPSITAVSIFEPSGTTQSLKDKLAETSRRNPMIIGVFWRGGGGHVMVGVDRDATSGKVIVSDPHFGVRHIESDGTYEPETGVRGNVTLAVYTTT